MIKYTPNKNILRHLLKIRKGPYRADQEYNFIREQVGQDYAMRTAFWRYYAGFVLYSPELLKQIPMGGYLFPPHLFDEEIMP